MRKLKSQIKNGLSLNTRSRVLLFKPDEISDFGEQIVIFIKEYVDRYHFKSLHVRTPSFIFDIDQEALSNIKDRLYKRALKFNDGYVGSIGFRASRFIEEPMMARVSRIYLTREFDLRIATLSQVQQITEFAADDMFIINLTTDIWRIGDTNVYKFDIANLDQLRFLFNMRSHYD